MLAAMAGAMVAQGNIADEAMAPEVKARRIKVSA